MGEQPPSAGAADFDTSTHQYFREVVWPKQRQYWTEQEAAKQRKIQQDGEAAEVVRQRYTEFYNSQPAERLEIESANYAERIRKRQVEIEADLARLAAMRDALESKLTAE